MAKSEVAEKPSLLAVMADRFGMMPAEFKQTIKATCFTGISNVTDEQLMMFLTVAHDHDLNPFVREIYAFPRPGGGIQVIVSVDGWMKLINKHPAFNGMEFVDTLDPQGGLLAIKCRMYRKDREHPVEASEYMAECRRNTDPWKQWPRRMLRHKAAIQAARYAFSYAGIIDPDEAERFNDRPVSVVVETQALAEVVEAIPDDTDGALPADEAAALEAQVEALEVDDATLLEVLAHHKIRRDRRIKDWAEAKRAMFAQLPKDQLLPFIQEIQRAKEADA